MSLSQKAKKLIVIGGPTAVGKTSLSIELAQLFNTKILSADSRQCYQELDIGVAKPSKEELSSVHHYFINSHSIKKNVTAGDYERFGIKTLEEIFQESNTAICVGGTGLYLKALCEGLDEMPKVDLAVKEEVEAGYEQNGLNWLQNELKKNDAAFYESCDQNNYMRLMRALIFYKSTGDSLLKYQNRVAIERPFDIELYAVEMDRKLLYKRINFRVDMMMEAGLLDEVKSLQQYEDLKTLKTVGYNEMFAHLSGEMSLDKAIEKVKQHTRNYAKRQVTWFRNQGSYQILTAEEIFKKLESTTCL